MKNKSKIPLVINDMSYPAIAAKDWNLVFRVGFYFKENIDVSVLKTAVIDMRERFPSFFANIKKGFFKYYLIHNHNVDIIEKENGYCRPFDLKSFSKPNIRIIYNENFLAVELFHAISDGYGAMEFLKCLTARYLELKNVNVVYGENVINVKSTAAEEETEDASKKYRTKKFKVYKLPPAYQYAPLQKSAGLIVSSRDFSIEKIKARAKKYNASVTQYLQSALHCALYKSGKSREKILTGVKVTISLRKMFPTKTLRNFSLYTNIQCQTDDNATIESVIKDTQDLFNNGTSKSRMQNFINATTAIFASPFWRILLLFTKNIITRRFYKKGQKEYSVTLSNFGIIQLPQALQNEVTGSQFIISDMPDKAVNCTAVSTADNLALFISSKDADNDFANCFFELINKECSEI